jgi:hypothetical protein
MTTGRRRCRYRPSGLRCFRQLPQMVSSLHLLPTGFRHSLTPTLPPLLVQPERMPPGTSALRRRSTAVPARPTERGKRWAGGVWGARLGRARMGTECDAGSALVDLPITSPVDLELFQAFQPPPGKAEVTDVRRARKGTEIAVPEERSRMTLGQSGVHDGQRPSVFQSRGGNSHGRYASHAVLGIPVRSVQKVECESVKEIARWRTRSRSQMRNPG